ncbi:MAG: PAS domain-containing protein [Thermoleophilia bacterium]|nr:PAS domain-containing protein [Thermoleophilia bacterium]
MPGLRTALLLLALLVPVASATWAFAEYAAARERERGDAHLGTMLRSAQEEYDDVVAAARARAARLAARAAVQRALARRRTVLRGVPGVALVPRAHPEPAAPATAKVVRGDRTLGYVVVGVALDAALVRRLHEASAARAADRVVIARAGTRLARLTPAAVDLRFGGRDYRAAAAPLARGADAPRVVALLEKSTVDEAAVEVRRRIFGVGAGTVFAVALLAYGFAPLIARNRTALRQRAQAARVLSQLADGVFEVDRDGLVTFWNPAATTITGIPADDVLGQPAHEAVPGWQAIHDLVPVAAHPGEPGGTRSDAVLVEHDGRERWLSMSAVAADGSVVYAFHDLTEKHRLEEMRSELVATVSHELRTPLAAVYGAALTLGRGAELEAAVQAQLVGVISDQAARLARIVDEVLLASQVTAGRLHVKDDAFDVSAVVASVADDARSRAPTGLRIESEATEPVDAAGDPERARQVIENLVDNAVKYSPDGGTVRIAVDADDRAVRVFVSDEGLGIPEAEQELVFEKFYRLDPQMNRGVGGTGLGLYIARELAEQMGGRVDVTSTPGMGSTFVLELRRPSVHGSVG